MSSSDEDSYAIESLGVYTEQVYDQDTDLSTDEGESHTDGAEGSDQTRTFDTNIPTSHTYLGELDHVRTFTMYDGGEIIKLLSLHTNTLVFPGFTLPLVIRNPTEISIMQEFLKEKNTFALVCADERETRLYRYGITMEVFEVFTKENCLHLKAKGRQRCKIVADTEIYHFGGRLQQVTVKILAEPRIVSPISETQLSSLKLKKPLRADDYSNLVKNYKYRRYHLSQFPNASWVYDHNEVSYYVHLILTELAKFFTEECLPTEATSLSYWFMQNFQLAHSERLHLMKLNSTLERLRLEYKLLHKERFICCRVCKSEITCQSNIFAMSKDGVQSNYCNPEGYVYETVTVTEAKNFNLHRTSSTKFSWFPGYAWTIMQCKVCSGHLGWMFTSKNLQPNTFYGLAKSGLYIKIDGSDR